MLVRTSGDLGALLRARRRELGLGQQVLASLIGVSRLWVIEFERGKARAEIGLVLRALTALELQLDVRNARAPSDEPPGVTPPPDIDAVVRAARKRR